MKEAIGALRKGSHRMSYQRLMEEHDRIDAALAVLSALCESDAPDLPAVVISLSDLAGELHRHLEHEDSFIYPQLMAEASGGVSDIAAAFVREFAMLREDWGLYLREWSADTIAADWASFRHETQSMATRLKARVDAENSLLYPAALQSNLITLRDAS